MNDRRFARELDAYITRDDDRFDADDEPLVQEVECRRCGGKFETADDDTLGFVCDACHYADWHDSDDD
jgi:ribosomal protein S27AE